MSKKRMARPKTITDAAIPQPIKWQASKVITPSGYPENWANISLAVKEKANWRCVRCGHDAEAPGLHRRKPCTIHCDVQRHPEHNDFEHMIDDYVASRQALGRDFKWNWPFQRQRMLTVHHLDMNKRNCFWWNLISVCQCCHLSIQARVKMSQEYMFTHSAWFKPYVAGYYAFRYSDLLLTREQVMGRLDEFLALPNEANAAHKPPRPT